MSAFLQRTPSKGTPRKKTRTPRRGTPMKSSPYSNRQRPPQKRRNTRRTPSKRTPSRRKGLSNSNRKAIAVYVKLYDIKILLGCASFHGTNVMKYTKELSYLRKNFSLPDELSVKSLDPKIYPAYTEINSNIKDLRTFVKLPPLIKGYLRIGGKVSHDCFVDYKFNTIDLCVIVNTNTMTIMFLKMIIINIMT